KFLKLINDAFDILNSRSQTEFAFKQAVNSHNIDNVIKFTEDFTNYISKLKFLNDELVIDSARKTGFIGFIAGLHSVVNIYKQFIDDKGDKACLKYLPVYKCSQDHLENFFSCVRSQGGCNDNPTCRQFT